MSTLSRCPEIRLLLQSVFSRVSRLPEALTARVPLPHHYLSVSSFIALPALPRTSKLLFRCSTTAGSPAFEEAIDRWEGNLRERGHCRSQIRYWSTPGSIETKFAIVERLGVSTSSRAKRLDGVFSVAEEVPGMREVAGSMYSAGL